MPMSCLHVVSPGVIDGQGIMFRALMGVMGRRLLWVNMVELSWVSILSFYGQQQRERAIAAAMQDAALPPAQVLTVLQASMLFVSG